MAVRLCGGTMRDFEALTSHSTVPHVARQLPHTILTGIQSARGRASQGKAPCYSSL